MTQSPARSAALPPFPAPPFSGPHTILQQLYGAMRDAYGRVDLLVFEMPAPGQANVLASFIDYNSNTVAYLDFDGFRSGDEQERLATLLRTSVVIVGGLRAAIETAPHRIARLLAWCTTNLPLTVVMTSNAQAITHFKPDHVRAAVDRMTPSDLARCDLNKSIAASLLQRVSKRGPL